MYRFRNLKGWSKIDPKPESNCTNEVSDDDAPVALHFKDVEQKRIKTEKAIKASILAAKKKSKTKSKSKDKSVNFAFPADLVKNKLTLTENEEIEKKMNEIDEKFEGSGADDGDVILEEFVNEPKSKKRPVAKATNDNNEFKLSDTFDFRKYLPESIFNEDGNDEGNGSEFDSEEELANAFLEGNYNDGSCDDLSDSEEPNNKKPKKKIKESRTLAVEPRKSELKRRRRGGRRLHKKYCIAPRVIILSRQNTAALIRQRTQAFVKERLFGSPKMKGPRRMTKEEMARSNLQLRARRMYLQGL